MHCPFALDKFSLYVIWVCVCLCVQKFYYMRPLIANQTKTKHLASESERGRERVNRAQAIRVPTLSFSVHVTPWGLHQYSLLEINSHWEWFIILLLFVVSILPFFALCIHALFSFFQKFIGLKSYTPHNNNNNDTRHIPFTWWTMHRISYIEIHAFPQSTAMRREEKHEIKTQIYNIHLYRHTLKANEEST